GEFRERLTLPAHPLHSAPPVGTRAEGESEISTGLRNGTRMVTGYPPGIVTRKYCGLGLIPKLSQTLGSHVDVPPLPSEQSASTCIAGRLAMIGCPLASLVANAIAAATLASSE